VREELLLCASVDSLARNLTKVKQPLARLFGAEGVFAVLGQDLLNTRATNQCMYVCIEWKRGREVTRGSVYVRYGAGHKRSVRALLELRHHRPI
jgi:hypothetical protein